MSRLRVDLDLLDQTVQSLGSCAGDLDDVHELVRRRTASLHESWSGLAAAAQLVAHADWSRAHADVQHALKDLRAAARVAHGNYGAAADANLRMWEALR